MLEGAGREEIVNGLMLCWILCATVFCTASQDVPVGAFIHNDHAHDKNIGCSHVLSDGFGVSLTGGDSCLVLVPQSTPDGQVGDLPKVSVLLILF